MVTRFPHWAGLGLLLAVLAGCGERELILEGERRDFRDFTPVDTPQDEEDIVSSATIQFTAGAASANSEWTHERGLPTRSLPQPQLDASLARQWSVSVGRGVDRRHRITASPVVADGRVFTLDSRSRLSAVSTGGQVLWSRDLTPAEEGRDDASGGGVSVSNGQVFVATAFGSLYAMNATSGEQSWVHTFDAPISGAATISDGRVFVTTRDGFGWALNAQNGRVLWSLEGTNNVAGVMGGSSPAATQDIVVFPFSSGEVVGVEPATGVPVWTNFLLRSRLGSGFASFRDLSGDPVIAGNVVYAANNVGQTVASDLTTGQVLWEAEEGAQSPAWVAGGSVFLINDQSELVRLNAANGERVWAVELPFFTRTRERRQKEIFQHYGPVLASGRLLVASNDGLLRSFDPTDGTEIDAMPIRGGAASEPAIAGGTLYIVSESGNLSAFR